MRKERCKRKLSKIPNAKDNSKMSETEIVGTKIEYQQSTLCYYFNYYKFNSKFCVLHKQKKL